MENVHINGLMGDIPRTENWQKWIWLLALLAIVSQLQTFIWKALMAWDINLNNANTQSTSDTDISSATFPCFYSGDIWVRGRIFWNFSSPYFWHCKLIPCEKQLDMLHVRGWVFCTSPMIAWWAKVPGWGCNLKTIAIRHLTSTPVRVPASVFSSQWSKCCLQKSFINYRTK